MILNKSNNIVPSENNLEDWSFGDRVTQLLR
jgi:hypothetical protein